MQLVEMQPTTSDTPIPLKKSPREENNENQKTALDKTKSSSIIGTSKLIKEEERQTGRISFNVYKVYLTEAYGWWSVIVVFTNVSRHTDGKRLWVGVRNFRGPCSFFQPLVIYKSVYSYSRSFLSVSIWSSYFFDIFWPQNLPNFL